MMPSSSYITEYAKNFGLEITDTDLEKFYIFKNFLKEYNEHTNLVSSNDIELVEKKHITDSLAFFHFLNRNEPLNIIDIGSGGGFPVIPIAILSQNSKITAVDSTKKKTDFLIKCSEKLNLTNLTVLNTRAENLAHQNNYREKFDIATARAVGSLNQISELCLPFINIEGLFISYKAAKFQEEIDNAQDAIKLLGGKIDEIFQYDLPLEENFTRNLVKIKKIETTPEIYPRSFSAIKNKPL